MRPRRGLDSERLIKGKKTFIYKTIGMIWEESVLSLIMSTHREEEIITSFETIRKECNFKNYRDSSAC